MTIAFVGLTEVEMTRDGRLVQDGGAGLGYEWPIDVSMWAPASCFADGGDLQPQGD